MATDLRIGEQTYRVVSSADPERLQALAEVVERKLRQVTPPHRARGPHDFLLAALALANDLDEAKERLRSTERRAQTLVSGALERIDAAVRELDAAARTPDA